MLLVWLFTFHQIGIVANCFVQIRMGLIGWKSSTIQCSLIYESSLSKPGLHAPFELGRITLIVGNML